MSPGEVDLHIHTTASSDGQHSPAKIVDMAAKLGLKAIAFADHNSIDNLSEGIKLSEESGIELIPCFELNTIYEGRDLHLLGYFVDYESPVFITWLGEIIAAKQAQEEQRLSALQSLGFIIDESDVKRIAGDRVPTGATFLEALLSREEGLKHPELQPYISGERSDSPALNFYTDYFKKGGPAYVPLNIGSTDEGIRKIKSFGGVPVQAHPSDTGDRIILELIEAGLMGLEAYSSYHTTEESAHFCRMADKNNILIYGRLRFSRKKDQT